MYTATNHCIHWFSDIYIENPKIPQKPDDYQAFCGVSLVKLYQC